MRIKTIIIISSLVVAQSALATERCEPGQQAPSNQILVGWAANARSTTKFSGGTTSNTVNLGEFRPVAVIENGFIKETPGSSIKEGQKFWLAGSQNEIITLTNVNGFLDQMGDAHCVYFASISGKQFPQGTLFTSRPETGFRKPTKGESELFYKLNTTCVNQGDYPTGKQPPCTRPTLLAITDVNNDKKLEFWATQPYMWDDGLSVWEYDKDQLIKIFEVCVGCSD